MASKIDILRRMDEAQGRNDVEGMFSVFTDDVLMHIGGKSRLAGDYKGRDQMMDVYSRFMQAMGEDAEWETHDLLASDTHGVMLQKFRGTGEGGPIEIDGIAIFHFQGDMIAEGWFFDGDPYAADKFYDANLK